MNSQRLYEISRVVARPRFRGERSRVSRTGLFCRAVLIALGVSLASTSCSKTPVIDQRVVTLYTLEDPPNAVTPSSCAVPTSAYAIYEAAGDFEPSPPQSGHDLNEMSPVLSEIPIATQQLTLDVSPPADASLSATQWRGYQILPATGDVAISLWPHGHECALKPNVDARPGGTITPYDDRHVLIAGGEGQPSFIADLSNGSVTTLSSSQDIGAQRAFATATPYSGGVVIAGGEVGNVPQNSAALFDAQSGSFSGDSILLTVSRANHAATRLTNGNVLLVGGGTSSSTLYQSLEVIDLAQKHSTQFGVAILVTARANPIALTLASGEVLVAGGVDGSGAAVGSLEWISEDATQNLQQATLPVAASHQQAFVALPAGGALGVISPDTTGPTTTWIITPDHKIQQGASLPAVPPGSNIRLFSGSDGAPLLWTGANWFRWSPWTGAFVSFSEATSVDGSTLANGPSVDAITASPDSGLALWLENDGTLPTAGKVLGLRFDSRGAYSTDLGSLLDSNTPKSLAPDRLPSATPDSSASTLTVDSVAGLTLTNQAAVVLSDATFADFSLDLDTTTSTDPSIGYPPVIFLRDDSGNEFSVGILDSGATCIVGDDVHWQLTRSGSTVTVVGSAQTSTTCSATLPATSRVTIGLRGRPAPNAQEPCYARNLVVTRN